jgi:hypothetical protein
MTSSPPQVVGDPGGIEFADESEKEGSRGDSSKGDKGAEGAAGVAGGGDANSAGGADLEGLTDIRPTVGRVV